MVGTGCDIGIDGLRRLAIASVENGLCGHHGDAVVIRLQAPSQHSLALGSVPEFSMQQKPGAGEC